MHHVTPNRKFSVTNCWSVGQFINSKMSQPLNLHINLENEAPSVVTLLHHTIELG